MYKTLIIAVMGLLFVTSCTRATTRITQQDEYVKPKQSIPILDQIPERHVVRDDLGQVVHVGLSRENTSTKNIELLSGIQSIRSLTLYCQMNFDIEYIEALRNFKDLQKLEIRYAPLNDLAIVKLSKIETLKSLNLTGAQFKIQDMDTVLDIKFPSLVNLNLSKSNVSKQFLNHIFATDSVGFVDLTDVDLDPEYIKKLGHKNPAVIIKINDYLLNSP